MKVAAIDIGSNSIHMIVVEAHPGRDLRILDREKEMVRLGDSAFADGRLSASAQARALSTISRFLDLARRRSVDAIVAAATSAVREADNGRQFLALVRRDTGQHVGLLGEREEARLIYMAVRDATDLRDRQSLIVDVGGGSTELIVGDAVSMRHAESLPLGVLRLNAQFDGTKPMRAKRRKALRTHIRAVIDEMVRKAAAAAVRRVIGTAGTVSAMARVLLAEEGIVTEGDAPSVQKLDHAAIHDLAERLLSATLAKRRRFPGLDPSRADTLGFGCAVVDEVLAAVEIDEIRTCRAAVREGMVIDYLATHPEAPAHRSTHDVRARSVRDAAARYGDTAEHGEHVARLAVSIFDGTRRLHRLGAHERELLELGALIHDVGQHVEYRRHHKHSYYLVKNAELQGFDTEEVEVLAVLARYHRRAAPKEEHEEWRALAAAWKPRARVMAGILRVADGLDRGHAQQVRSVEVRTRGDTVRILVTGKGDLSLDVWGASSKSDLLAEALRCPVEIRLAPVLFGKRRRTSGTKN